jgi:hypothetical protein
VKVLTPIVLRPGVKPEAVGAVEYVAMPLDWFFAAKSEADLIDQIAKAEDHLKAITKWAKAGREVLKKRWNAPSAGEILVTPGQMFQAEFATKVRMDIDRESVRKDMGDEWYAAHCARTEYQELRFKPLTGATPDGGGESAE